MQKGVINQAQLDDALTYQLTHKGTPVGESFITLGFVTQKQVDKVLRKQYRVRLYTTVAAFYMAPSHLCHADNSEIEHLPEYEYTQIADQQYDFGDSAAQFANADSGGSTAGLDVLSMALSAAWYMYEYGVDIEQKMFK